jgi:hypothetical protein
MSLPWAIFWLLTLLLSVYSILLLLSCRAILPAACAHRTPGSRCCILCTLRVKTRSGAGRRRRGGLAWWTNILVVAAECDEGVSSAGQAPGAAPGAYIFTEQHDAARSAVVVVFYLAVAVTTMDVSALSRWTAGADGAGVSTSVCGGACV